MKKKKKERKRSKKQHQKRNEEAFVLIYVQISSSVDFVISNSLRLTMRITFLLCAPV